MKYESPGHVRVKYVILGVAAAPVKHVPLGVATALTVYVSLGNSLAPLGLQHIDQACENFGVISRLRASSVSAQKHG